MADLQMIPRRSRQPVRIPDRQSQDARRGRRLVRPAVPDAGDSRDVLRLADAGAQRPHRLERVSPHDPSGVVEVGPLRLEARVAHLREQLSEQLALSLGHGRGRIVGLRQVAHDPFQLDLRRRAQTLEDRRQVLRQEAQPPHARVQLQVDGRAHPRPLRSSRDRFQMRRAHQRGHHLQGQQLVRVSGRKRPGQ